MGFDEFGPAHPDAPITPPRPMRSRILDWTVLILFIASLFWLLGCAPALAADSIQWVPRIFVTTKDGSVQLWRNKVHSFDTENECMAYFAEHVTEIDDVVHRAYGDALDHFKPGCYMVIPERDI